MGPGLFEEPWGTWLRGCRMPPLPELLLRLCTFQHFLASRLALADSMVWSCPTGGQSPPKPLRLHSQPASVLQSHSPEKGKSRAREEQPGKVFTFGITHTIYQIIIPS